MDPTKETLRGILDDMQRKIHGTGALRAIRPISSSRKENVKVQGPAWRPQIHQLASLEADLKLAESYCRQCEAHTSNPDIRIPRGEMLTLASTSQRAALQHAGKAIEDLRNYNINLPETDIKLLLYATIIKPVVDVLAEGLGAYREGSHIAQLLREFVEEAQHDGGGSSHGKYAGDRQGSRDHYDPFDSISGDNNVNIGSLPKMALDAAVEHSEAAGNFAGAKVAGHLYGLIDKYDREALIELVKRQRERLHKSSTEELLSTGEPTENIRKGVLGFMEGCSARCVYAPVCNEYRQELVGGQQTLSQLLKTRGAFQKDVTNGLTWLLDVTARVLEMVPDDEYLMLRQAAKGYIAQKLEVKD